MCFFFYPVPVNFPQEAYALQTSLPFFSGALHYGYRAKTADSPEMVRSVELFCAVCSLQSFQGQKPLKAARFFQCFTWKAFSYYLLTSWLFYPKVWLAARGMESSVERGAPRPSCDSWLTLYKHYHIRQEWKRKKEKIHWGHWFFLVANNSDNIDNLFFFIYLFLVLVYEMS